MESARSRQTAALREARIAIGLAKPMREPKLGTSYEFKAGAFEKAAQKIAKKQKIPMKNARAILAAGARKASPAAVRKNPSLRRVKGVGKK